MDGPPSKSPIHLTFSEAASAAKAALHLKKRADAEPLSPLDSSAWLLFSPHVDSRSPKTPVTLSAEPEQIKDRREDDIENSSDSSDSEEDGYERPFRSGSSTEQQASLWHSFLQTLQAWTHLTAVQKNVLKCSLAYLLASLFTYLQPLSDFVGAPFDAEGPVANAHFIATIATYYNPAKLIGNMIEADIFMIWAALFSLIVCFGSMATAIVLNNDGLEWLSHTIVLCFWLAGSCGFVAYMKNLVGRATFGSACSMTVLINSVIICKEGAVHLGIFEWRQILQTLFIVLIGTLISNIVCFAIWSGSSVVSLQNNINKTLDSFATLISLLSKTFLLEEDFSTSDHRLASSIKAHGAAFSGLKSALLDAKLEFFDPRIQRCHETYDEVIESMTRLAQHLTGLRSGCNFQSKILSTKKGLRPDGNSLPVSGGNVMNGSMSPEELTSKIHLSAAEDDVDEYTKDAQLFSAFQQHIEGTLEDVTSLCRKSCRTMRSSFTHSRASLSQLAHDDLENGDQIGLLSKLHLDLGKALSAFTIAHGKALKTMYKNYPATIGEGQDDTNDVMSRGPNEGVFTIFFFLFNLEEFAKELLHLMELFISIREEEESLDRRRLVLYSKYGVFLGWICYSLDIGHAGRMPSARKRTVRWKTLKDRLRERHLSSKDADL